MQYTIECLEKMLDMIHANDFRMVHMMVARGVQAGTLSKEFEDEYRKLVDSKLHERGPSSWRNDGDGDDDEDEDDE